MNKHIGIFVKIEGSMVDIIFPNKVLPKIEQILTIMVNNQNIYLEVIAIVDDNKVRTLCFAQQNLLSKGLNVDVEFNDFSINIAESIFGRVVNVFAKPVDGLGDFSTDISKIGLPKIESINISVQGKFPKILYTGIKIIDFMCPIFQGSKVGIVASGSIGKTVLGKSILERLIKTSNMSAIVASIVSRMNEFMEMYKEFVQKSYIFPNDYKKSKIAMFQSCSSDNPINRYRILFSAILATNYLRENLQKDMLLFIDDFCGFVQAGAEISHLLGQRPSWMGYQPNLESQIDQIQESIVSTPINSITSIEVVSLAEENKRDPIYSSVCKHFDVLLMLSRDMFYQGFVPAILPLESFSNYLSVENIEQRHYELAIQVNSMLQRHKEMEDMISVLGLEDLSLEEHILISRTKKIHNFFIQSISMDQYTEEELLNLNFNLKFEDTLSTLEAICSGELDDITDEAFIDVNTVSEIKAKALKIYES